MRLVLSCLVLPCLVHRLPLLRALLISCRRHRFGAARVLLPAAHSTPTRLDGQRWHTRHESATTLCRARLAATTTQREASRECHRIGHTSASASIRTPLESSGHLSLQWRLAGGRVRHILSCLVFYCLVLCTGRAGRRCRATMADHLWRCSQTGREVQLRLAMAASNTFSTAMQLEAMVREHLNWSPFFSRCRFETAGNGSKRPEI